MIIVGNDEVRRKKTSKSENLGTCSKINSITFEVWNEHKWSDITKHWNTNRIEMKLKFILKVSTIRSEFTVQDDAHEVGSGTIQLATAEFQQEQMITVQLTPSVSLKVRFHLREYFVCSEELPDSDDQYDF